MRIKRRIAYMAFPLMICFLLITIPPLIYSVYEAMINGAVDRRFVGMRHFVDVLGNRYFQRAMINTLRFLGIGVPIVLMIGFLLALFFAHYSDQRIGWTVRAALILPMLMPAACGALAFGLLLPETGSLARLLTWTDERFRLIPALCIYIWKNTGFIMLVLLAAVRGIPRELYEAAALDGAGAIIRFCSVTLPSCLGALLFVTTYAITQSLRAFREIYAMYGAYPGEWVYLVQHSMNNHFYKLNYQKVAATGVLFALFVASIVILSMQAERRLT